MAIASMRNGSVYVDAQVLWLFGRLVKAHNSQLGDTEVPITVDGLANDVLLQWIKTAHPKLLALAQRRKAIDDEAIELLAKKPQ